MFFRLCLSGVCTPYSIFISLGIILKAFFDRGRSGGDFLLHMAGQGRQVIRSFTHSVTRSIAMTMSFPGRCIVAAFLANVTLSSACRQAMVFQPAPPIFHLPHVSEASPSPSASTSPSPAASAHSCPLYTHSEWRSSGGLTALHFSFIFPRRFLFSIHPPDNHIKIQPHGRKNIE